MRPCFYAGLAASLLLAGSSELAPRATAAPGAASAAGAAAQAASSESVCRLLTDADARKVFPDAKPGQPDLRNQKYGIVYCRWEYGTGTFYIRLDNEEPAEIESEAEGLVQGFLDPVHAASKGAVRYQAIAGVGDAAIAAVETADKSKGVLSDFGLLFVHSAKRQLVLFSSDLAKRDRAEALKALEALGKTAVGRL